MNSVLWNSLVGVREGLQNRRTGQAAELQAVLLCARRLDLLPC
jgi:hypothetical protein